MDYRLLMKKLILREYELLGASDIMEAVENSEGTQFTNEEQEAVREVRDDAYAEWLFQFETTE